jgi:DNA-binding NtrC family response regulator/pSer/pThr/pTyr-binding forkhead associated (FHA) protein
MPFDEEATTASFPDRRRALEQRVSLVIYLRGGVKVVTLDANRPVVVGRGEGSDVVVEDSTVSRRHARFNLVKGQVWVEDMMSSNGTFVGGKRVAESAAVTPDDEIRLGAISVGLHFLGPTERQRSLLVSHDRFFSDLEDEVERGRAYGRKVGLVSVRSDPRFAGHISRWCPRVQRLLRPFDRVAMYGADEIEILVPEATNDALMKLGQAIVDMGERDGPLLLCGVALLPESASSADELLEVSRKACQQATPERPIRMAVKLGLASTPSSLRLSESDEDAPVVRSAAMQQVFDTVRRLANSMIPVLIYGETGTGKEVVARALHKRSPRRSKPLLCVNCGAIPEQLIESALFGHERGAFTGAHARAHGVFEEADGGTVLLDEIGELPPSAQSALLRVLETKRVTRVGSSKEIQVDVRILAATNRDLEAMCATKAFRWDLLYRLNTMTLRVPPLRERIDEIEALVRHFIQQANLANGCQVTGLERQALSLLHRYPWPGNVRELRNVIERAVVLVQEGLISADALSERVRAAGVSAEPHIQRPPHHKPTQSFSAPLEDEELDTDLGATDSISMDQIAAAGLRAEVQKFEQALLLVALERTGWNQAQAARDLRIPLRTLFHKIKTYGLRQADEETIKTLGSATDQAKRDLDAGDNDPFKVLVQRQEGRLIRAAYQAAGRDKTETARWLDISTRALAKKLKVHKID